MDNHDQDKRFIDEYYNDVNEKLKTEKDSFKEAIQKQLADEMNDLRAAEKSANDLLEQHLERIKALELQVEQMNTKIKELLEELY